MSASKSKNTFTKDPNTIYFYRQGDPYGEFSNFYPSPFLDQNNKTWPTSEHYFQAKKFINTEHEEIIRNLKTASESAKQGRSRSRPLRKDWEEVKVEVMYEAIKYKFEQNDGLREVLMGTGDKKIVEHTKNDRIWADGGDGSGKNLLGVLLMRLRGEFRNEEK